VDLVVQEENNQCPYCGNELTIVELNTACGRYWYQECFDCGWCGEEHYSKDFYFGDPDLEWNDLWE